MPFQLTFLGNLSTVHSVFGTKIYVDIEISADGNLLLRQSHEIAEMVHDNIEREFPDVKHCTVHVNPAGYEHKKLP